MKRVVATKLAGRLVFQHRGRRNRSAYKVLVSLGVLSRNAAYPPCLRDIQVHAGLSSVGLVWRGLKLLAKRGLILRGEAKAYRTWRPNYDAVLFVTEGGVTEAYEWRDA